MRALDVTPFTQPFSRKKLGDQRLSQYLSEEIEDALSANHALYASFRECLRMYEGIPKNPYRNTPIENAPNIEVTLGAIACDALYAQAVSAIFSASPIITARTTMRASEDRRLIEGGKAAQAFIDWGIANEWHIREACDHSFLDDIQLGTGIGYCPWQHHIKRTKTREVADVGPRLISVPVEDFLVPGGSQADVQSVPWCAVRMWMTEGELHEYGKVYPGREKQAWKIDKAQPCGNVGWVRSARENLGRTYSNSKVKKLYEIFLVFPYFDYDDDGCDEDLMVVWDRTAQKILWRGYNPFDRRPFPTCRYQLRAHLWNGLGVLEMLRPYQEEVTDGHNDRATNVKLANMQMYGVATGSQIDEESILSAFGNRIIRTANPKEDIVPIRFGEIYPSAFQAEALTAALAERRVGMSEPIRSSQMLGGRTPAFTAASLLQRENNRFTPAFDSMRGFVKESAIECLFRYRERLLIGDARATETIVRVLGGKAGGALIHLLTTEDFQQYVSLEVTASSATVNRDAEKQNAMLLTQILANYYEKTVQMMLLAANPQTPPPIKAALSKIAERTGEIVDRTLRTFDQVRDPATFIVDVSQELDQLNQQPDVAQGLAQLTQMMGGGPGNGVTPPASVVVEEEQE